MTSQFENRPLLPIVAALILGLAVPSDWVLVLLLLPTFYFAKRVSTAILVTAAFLIGWLIHPTMPIRVTEARPIGTITKVASVPKTFPEFQTCLVESEGSLFKFETRDVSTLDLGDTLKVEGQLRPFKEAEEEYWLLQGAQGVIRTDSFTKVASGPIYFQWGGNWRRAFMEMTSQHLDDREANTINALCFNVDWLLEEQDRENLRRTGTTHIISASGLHVVIFVVALGWVLQRLPITRPQQIAILTLILLIYAGAAGLRPPVVRAILMAFAGMTAYLFRREPDWPSALAGSAIIYLLFEPRAIYDIGFQLSYVTIFAITILAPEYQPKENLIEKLKAGFLVSLAASIGSAPIIAYHFGSVSLISPIANVLIASVIPFIIVPSMALLLIPFAAPMVLQFPVGLGVSWLYWVIETLGPLSWSAIDVPGFNGYWLIPIYAALLAVWRFKPRPA